MTSHAATEALQGFVAPATPEAPTVRGPKLLELELPPGTVIGRYEVIRELGRGGMGRVLLARDTSLARLVALKFLQALDGDNAERFVVEARSTARCQHENIIVVYSVDEWEGAPYMALEYLEGASLGELLDGETLEVSKALEILIPVVRALVRAHAFNIVHCDLKPDNVFVTRDGGVKVLDFGIARITVGADPEQLRAIHAELARGLSLAIDDGNTCYGTPAFMSFEQWGLGEIDHRSDIWAFGVMCWEVFANAHPMGQFTKHRVMEEVVAMEQPLPSLATAAPHLPKQLIEIVDRCLAKAKEHRFPTAAELLAALEQLAPTRAASRGPAAAPFPGLAAFQEADADRFFGRNPEIAAAQARLAEQPLVALAGPSGIGKSSFVRAGLVPALKASAGWEVVIVRPGRAPIANLLDALHASWQRDEALAGSLPSLPTLAGRARERPGEISAILRRYATRRSLRVLIFVDQFEELYTNAAQEEREAFAAVLRGLADDVSSPLRVVVSIRSDFVDRVAEDRALLDRMTRGLMFLGPLTPSALGDALTQPLAHLGYAFEAGLVDTMVKELAGAHGALPLLQFTAASLWDRREVEQRRLTRAAYDELGGIAGALAKHAEGLVHGLSASQVLTLRAIVLRLVTPEGTRSVVERSELEQLGDPRDTAVLLDLLIEARLLSADSDDARARLELIHESLITHWPSLRRWREESSEHAAFLHELRPVVRQWVQRGKPAGLLWSGDALGEARAYLGHGEALSLDERAFIEAGVHLAERARRRRRRLVIGGFTAMGLVVAAALIALVIIRAAQQDARAQSELAQREATRARVAETEAKRRLTEFLDEQQERKKADAARLAAVAAAKEIADAQRRTAGELATAETAVVHSREELEATNRQLAKTLREALSDKRRAEEAVAQAAVDRGKLEKRLASEAAEIARLRAEAGRLVSGGGLQ